VGKIRIKQIGESLEDTKEPTDSVVAKLASSKKKKGKPTHPRQLHGRSKRYKKAAETKLSSKSKKSLALGEAVALVKKIATAKFDETIELHLTVKKKGLTAKTTLPHSTGKKQNILILTANPKSLKSAIEQSSNRAMKSVAVQLAGQEIIDKIKKNGVSQDAIQIWATPDIMPKVAQIAKILGPKGLMPNPKKETVVKPQEISKKLKSLAGGSITLETERKAPIIHTTIGKSSMKPKQLEENLEAILTAVKPQNIKKAILTSTMGPAVNIKINE
jgi:large subunit ribosomal protein L1